VYSKRFQDHPDNLISGDGIVLVSNWHPLADKPMRFSLSADLPHEFTAISEADTFPLTRSGNTVSARFSRPVTAIHFVAGPYEVKKLQVREDLTLYSLFFAEDADLAEDYLRHGAEYLRRYEQELGPYPYRHYAIVANRLPSGLGIPTFSLFGRTVLRLPFIKTTSLGHEIVHAWFGNGVEVDAHGGNWCEGLTAFLSDHRYREEREKGLPIAMKPSTGI
jgi:aminopeptidase N